MSWENILKLDPNKIDFNEYPDISNSIAIFKEMQEEFIEAEYQRQKELLEEIIDDALNQLTQEDLDNPDFDMTELLNSLSRQEDFRMQEELQ